MDRKDQLVILSAGVAAGLLANPGHMPGTPDEQASVFVRAVVNAATMILDAIERKEHVVDEPEKT